MHIQTRDNHQLFVKEWGEGRPVILIHGWPLTADTWDAVGMALAAAGCRAIAYDRRGFGRSEQPWQGYDYDTLTDDLRDVMEATGAIENVALVGFSMGGGEVARYQSRYQGDGVSQAVLISSVVPYLLQTEDNAAGVDADTLKQMATGMEKDRPDFMRQFLKDFFGVSMMSHPVSDAQLDWAWAQCMEAGLNPTLECAKSFGFTDFRPDMKHFKVPTLIIHGTGDEIVPIDATGRAAATQLDMVELKEYSDAPHGLFLTHEEKLIHDLKQFLA